MIFLLLFSLNLVHANQYCAVSEYGNELECFNSASHCEKAAEFLNGHCNVRSDYAKPRGKLYRQDETVNTKDQPYQDIIPKYSYWNNKPQKQEIIIPTVESRWGNSIQIGPTAEELLDEMCNGMCHEIPPQK